MLVNVLRLTPVALGLLFVIGCSQPTPDLRPEGAAVSPRLGEAAPEFSLPSTGGGRLDLSDFRGKSSVLLYFSMGPG